MACTPGKITTTQMPPWKITSGKIPTGMENPTGKKGGRVGALIQTNGAMPAGRERGGIMTLIRKQMRFRILLHQVPGQATSGESFAHRCVEFQRQFIPTYFAPMRAPDGENMLPVWCGAQPSCMYVHRL